MDTTTALVVVDLQNDFCPGGSLAVQGGNEIIPAVNRVIAWFSARGLPIFASRDWHPEKTVHFRTFGGPWPPHCVQGTRGAEFHPDLLLPPEVRIVSKGTRPDSDDYSAFHALSDDGRPLADILEGLGVTRIVVCGIATDYCVWETVKEARRRGLAVTVLLDGVRGVNVNPGDSERALEEMASLGAKTATVGELLE